MEWPHAGVRGQEADLRGGAFPRVHKNRVAHRALKVDVADRHHLEDVAVQVERVRILVVVADQHTHVVARLDQHRGWIGVVRGGLRRQLPLAVVDRHEAVVPRRIDLEALDWAGGRRQRSPSPEGELGLASHHAGGLEGDCRVCPRRGQVLLPTNHQDEHALPDVGIHHIALADGGDGVRARRGWHVHHDVHPLSDGGPPDGPFVRGNRVAVCRDELPCELAQVDPVVGHVGGVDDPQAELRSVGVHEHRDGVVGLPLVRQVLAVPNIPRAAALSGRLALGEVKVRSLHLPGVMQHLVHAVGIHATLVPVGLVLCKRAKVFEEEDYVREFVDLLGSGVVHRHWPIHHQRDCQAELMLEAVVRVQPVRPDHLLFQLIHVQSRPTGFNRRGVDEGHPVKGVRRNHAVTVDS
mmetsp:Transcript_20499/g.53324  ORF Transcript_20499/g.53324 Transcript_20499/m.53324 type:complete len:409 (-) Transcript_20499:342-1568(-)